MLFDLSFIQFKILVILIWYVHISHFINENNKLSSLFSSTCPIYLKSNLLSDRIIHLKAQKILECIRTDSYNCKFKCTHNQVNRDDGLIYFIILRNISDPHDYYWENKMRLFFLLVIIFAYFSQ